MKHDHISFIHYNMDQLILPMDLEVIIPPHHVSRIVHDAVEKLNLDLLTKPFKGGGRSSYHPKMMVKIIVYAYTQRIYSSRLIEKALDENKYFMWLSGNQLPDFRTINRFRSEYMKDIIYEIFFSIVNLLREKGVVKLEHYYLDGTKIEANANHYTFVWRKSTEKYDQKLDETYRQIVATIEDVVEEDLREEASQSMQEKLAANPVTSKQIEATVKQVEERLEKDPKNKALKKTVKKLKNDLLPRKQKYENQKEIFKDRNSYSKTDTDATFMRMKEDHMKNGQLKPGYNVQMGTENQFVVGYSVHQRPGDTKCLKPHLDLVKKYLGKLPKGIAADATYGTEENYEYLKEQELTAYVKYNTFDIEQTKAWKKEIGRIENMEYDTKLDEFICATGKRLTFQYESKKKSDTGYESIKRKYSCFECKGCPFQEVCAKGKENKTINLSVKNLEQRNEIRELLTAEEGQKVYSRRKIDVEPVFGQIKHNRGFRRFMLKGLSKTNIEWGLLCVAHNLLKLNQIQNIAVK